MPGRRLPDEPGTGGRGATGCERDGELRAGQFTPDSTLRHDRAAAEATEPARWPARSPPAGSGSGAAQAGDLETGEGGDDERLQQDPSRADGGGGADAGRGYEDAPGHPERVGRDDGADGG